MKFKQTFKNIKNKISDFNDHYEITYKFYRFFDEYIKLSTIKRKVKFFFQRKIRGFDDSETWDLDTEFYKWILPRLKRFKRVSNDVHPSQYTNKQWQKQLNKAIENLEFILTHDEFDKNYAKNHDQFIDWFCKHLDNLWW